jgi:3-deoxy-7-phosphoheptulonate synthase
VLNRIDDLRITQVRPLLPPAILLEEIPITDRASELVAATRQAIAACSRDRTRGSCW